MTRRLRSGVVALLLLALPAAGSETNNAVATITGATSGSGRLFTPNQRVIITHIDHKKVHGPRPFSTESNPQRLTRGRHIISVEIEVESMHATGTLWLDAEAGKSYIVRKRVEGYGVRFWIEDTATGQTVGGREPGED